MRSCGVLLHITSLPSQYGIGTMGKCAYEFIDFLIKAGQQYWQILPTTPTGEGNSPYSSYSVFAGNPLFIDLELLIEEGLLTKEECDAVDFGENPLRVDYDKVIAGKYNLLKKAYTRFLGDKTDFELFCSRHAVWLTDYALYMALKEQFGNSPWYSWQESIRLYEPEAVQLWKSKLAEEIKFWCFVQYVFHRQWCALKAYANQKGIGIIGDIPIYVAMDSADVWAGKQLFQLDSKGLPTDVAGVPPDGFSATGQLWGNPLYNWAGMKQDGYAWWVRRVRHTAELCDVIRFDHFRGFDEYYAIPYGDKTAENGQWKKGPGIDLFRLIDKELDNPKIIAEDLGLLTDGVRKLLADSGYPGMKVLQFAFDSDWKNPYLPYNYITDNAVVYTGTHDNDTVCGWYAACASSTRRFARKYLDISRTDKPNWKMIGCAYQSGAKLAMVQMQDFLALGSEARMNIPSVPNGNWEWRMLEQALSEKLALKIRKLVYKYRN